MAKANDCSIVLDTRQTLRDGTSQTRRALAALEPGSIPVDEHGLAEWMVFAERYAEYVRFYDTTHQVAGNWQAFFKQSPLAALANVAVQDSSSYKAQIARLFQTISTAEAADLSAAKQALSQCFNALATLSVQLDQLLQRLDSQSSLRGLLQNSISSELRFQLARLIADYQAASDLNLLENSTNDDTQILNRPLMDFAQLAEQSLSTLWYDSQKHSSWAAYFGSISADLSIFGNGHLPDPLDSLHFAVQHNLFSGIFDSYGKVYARLISEARLQLNSHLTDASDQEPHYALFLAFLRLLETVRDHINTLTQRHLDFYYREVLRLSPKPLQANQAHILLQLAKQQSSYLLPANTELNAGKDSLGKAVRYRVLQDTSINRALVSHLQSVRQANQGLYAFPITNSADGAGATLTDSSQAWSVFETTLNESSRASLGFAIASHYLLLGEGLRKIRLNLRFDQTLSQQLLSDSFEFWVTGPKGWIAASLDFGNKTASSNASRSIKIPLLIDGSQPAIVPLQSAVHGNQLPKGLPTLKAVLKADAALSLQRLQALKLQLLDSSVDVAVGYADWADNQPDASFSGLKNLHISNGLGPLKADKPFMPFGAQPKSGDFLLIGSDELFQKAGAEWQLQVSWKGLPDWRGNMDLDWVNEFAPSAQLSWLKNGSWSADSQSLSLFDDLQANVTIPARSSISLDEQALSAVHFDNQPYTLEQRNGFMKLSLQGDFGHALYQPTLARYLIRLTQDPDSLLKDGDTASLRDEVYKLENGRYVPKNLYTFQQDFVEHYSRIQPIAPYTPEINSLSLCYRASVNFPDTQLYWISPFGYLSIDSQTSEADVLPVVSGQAELYIGIQQLQAPQNLSMLFQVLEGSANPTVAKPDAHIEWSYLSNNQWQTFGDTELSDATAQLTRSGIIRFSMPRDASDNDSLMLSNATYWLRGKIDQAADAVCKLISVSPQAALLSFYDQDNAADFLNTPLAAGSIQKLSIPDAKIKKIEQPYDSFGGRPAEADPAFYNRVSERLRHKNRAIMPWDFEHLILEAFPGIYKVKCLNHTRMEPASDGKSMIYHELAAGHITLVTLPDLKNRNSIDPLRPYTSLGDLDLISGFLQNRISPFVTLHVRNPFFEAVRSQFKVKFYDGVDEGLHLALLQQAIVQFLSPWAFDQATDIQFGGRIYKSALINFVEQQSYVDYVSDFELFAVDENGMDGPNVEVVAASTAISILVSVSAEQHRISAISATSSSHQAQVCSC